jgi:dienelactone hydrolase
MKQSARELAGVGYVVLALAGKGKRPEPSAEPSTGFPALADEPALAELSAAVRWLRRRPDVFPDRLGVAGWSSGGEQALALAASTPLQACVVCDSPVSDDAALIAGLRWTPVLGLFPGQNKKLLEALPAFRKSLKDARIIHKLREFAKVEAGFMGPPGQKEYALEAAEEAWVEVYEFLGKYVEDAPENGPLAQAGARARGERKNVATVGDLMRSINGPDGVRGVLIEALRQKPADARQWNRVRGCAALIAEAGSLLQAHTPRKGGLSHWHDCSRRFRIAAEEVVTAADRQDYAAAQKGLKDLGACCATCHERHR